MSSSHKKIKNIGIIFEILNINISNKILKEEKIDCFSLLSKIYNSELIKEWNIYNIISKTHNLNEEKAKELLNLCLENIKKIDHKKTKKLKFDLIKEIKNTYGIDNFFKQPIENYKLLASVYMLIENEITDNYNSPQALISSKETILEHLTKNSKKEEEKNEFLKEYLEYPKQQRLLILKQSIKNFDSKYNNLKENQKNLLKKYLFENSNDFKNDLNKEIIGIKKYLKEYLSKTPKNNLNKIKLEEIQNMINPIEKNIQEKDITNVLYFMELIDELKNEKIK